MFDISAADKFDFGATTTTIRRWCTQKCSSQMTHSHAGLLFCNFIVYCIYQDDNIDNKKTLDFYYKIPSRNVRISKCCHTLRDRRRSAISMNRRRRFFYYDRWQCGERLFFFLRPTQILIKLIFVAHSHVYRTLVMEFFFLAKHSKDFTYIYLFIYAQMHMWYDMKAAWCDIPLSCVF